MNTQTDSEPIQGELIDSSEALMALNKSEIDVQIATAKQFPRSLAEFKNTARELACLDEDTAASMFYTLSRRNKDGSRKKIQGPSIRMAEIVAYSWTNLRFEARIVSIDEKFVTAQATCMDLERNTAGRGECKRRITTSDGHRYSDDMIQVTSNAACSIALREAVFKVVPRSMFNDIYKEAIRTSIGKATSVAEMRAKAIEWFQSVHATEEQVLEWLDRRSLDEITIEDLTDLRGLVTAIKDGEMTIETAFETHESKARKRARVESTAAEPTKRQSPAEKELEKAKQEEPPAEPNPPPKDDPESPDFDPLGELYDNAIAAIKRTQKPETAHKVAGEWSNKIADAGGTLDDIETALEEHLRKLKLKQETGQPLLD